MNIRHSMNYWNTVGFVRGDVHIYTRLGLRPSGAWFMWVQAGADVPGLSAASPGTTGRQDGETGGLMASFEVNSICTRSVNRSFRPGVPPIGSFPGQ